MADETTDAKTETESSAAQAEETTATQTSQQTDSSTEQKEPTLADVAKQAYDQATQAEDQTEGVKESSVEQEHTEQVKTEETTEAKTEEVKAETSPDEKLPFHEHPRWKEVLTERDSFKEKALSLEPRVKELEPLAQQMEYHNSFCAQHGISAQDVANAMDILALQKTDPAKALERLTPIWNQLQEFSGSVVPADLRKRVEEGELSEAAAQEIAQLRAKSKAGEYTGRLTAQQAAAQRQAAQAQSIAAWDRSKRGSDPDFKPKTDPNAPDGIWEMTAAKFAYLMTNKFATTPEAAIAHLEKAYAESKRIVTALRTPPKPTGKVLTSTRSSGQRTVKEPESIKDVVAQVARQHGMNWTPNGE